MYSPTSSFPQLSDVDPEILRDFDKLRNEQYGAGHTLDGLVEQIDARAREEYIMVPVDESVECPCLWEVMCDGLLHCELRQGP